MDIDSPFTMVVLIVLITVGAGVLNNWIKMRRETERGAVEAEQLEALKADVDRLKERVQVLEKLTTDSDAQLRDSFRNLA
ncbi:MAG: hypothetical protein AAGJ84_08855 [Pseudomonadota bacterium]